MNDYFDLSKPAYAVYGHGEVFTIYGIRREAGKVEIYILEPSAGWLDVTDTNVVFTEGEV